MLIKKLRSVSSFARVFYSNHVHHDTKTIVLCLHGYGQLADEFLLEFSPLFSEKVCFVGAEGISRFYLRGGTGKLGASWMTSMERGEEIRNYLEYLSALLEELCALARNAKVVILGFSQGAATASRLCVFWKGKIEKLIVCSSKIPEDVLQTNEIKIPVDMIYSDEDAWHPLQDFELHFLELEKRSIPYKSWKFNGKHELNMEILQNILDKV